MGFEGVPASIPIAAASGASFSAVFSSALSSTSEVIIVVERHGIVFQYVTIFLEQD